MKIVFSIIYFIFFTNLTLALENKILIKVNNEIITTVDLLNEIKYLNSINNNFKDFKKEEIYMISKKSLIREKIKEIELLNYFKEIKIKDEFFDNLINDHIKRLKFSSLAEFKNHLKNNDVKFEVIKKKITVEILWNRLIFNKFSKNVKIDREQIKNELNNSNIKKELLLSEILFTVENNENLVDKYKLIVKNINEKNFDKAASIYSISDTSKNSGKLGWIPMLALNETIKKELLNIKIGNFTKPIVVPGGFLIIKINDARKTEDKIDIKKEVESVVEKKTNEQLNQFSVIYFNKIKKNIKISEL